MSRNIIEELGYYTPWILSGYVFLWFIWKGLWLLAAVFTIGYWINISLNLWLKGILREPRPIRIDLDSAKKRDMRIWKWFGCKDDIEIDPVHIYGMPSWHAQVSSFAIMFYYLTFKKQITPSITPIFGNLLIMIFLLFITLYQRWISKSHSIIQLFLGVFIGSLFANIYYYIFIFLQKNPPDFYENIRNKVYVT